MLKCNTGLPETEEELTQFVLAGKCFYNVNNWNDTFYDYMLVCIHIAENLHLIKRAWLEDLQTIKIEMRGTNECISLHQYDQCDRYLYKQVFDNLL